MSVAFHLDALRDNGARLAEAAVRAGLDAEVPTCPGWSVRDLLVHISGVHRWAASYVITGRSEPLSKEAEDAYFVTPADVDIVAWYRDGHAALVEALGVADPALACWSFLPAPSPLAFWARRQAHETTIHRVDAERAGGSVSPIDPRLAADGIDELLNGFLARPRGKLVADPPVTLAVRATDADATWTVRIEPDRRQIVSGAQPADLTIVGPASDLYLLLWNRGDAEGLTLTGDWAVLHLWRAKATVRWA